MYGVLVSAGAVGIVHDGLRFAEKGMSFRITESDIQNGMKKNS